MSSATYPSYGRDDFWRFIAPLRFEAKYDGDVAIFVVEATRAFKNNPDFGPWCAAQRIDVVVVPSVDCPGRLASWTTCAEDAEWGPTVPAPLIRYRLYAKYLAERAPYDLVLWTDFLDVVFQRDPFPDFAADAKGRDLLFFAEHPGKPLNDEGFTRSWVESCYGAGALASLAPSTPVLCSSNVMGTGAAVAAFLRKYADAVTDRARNGDPEYCVRVNGIDQGHHNYLVYVSSTSDGTFPDYAVAPYDAGPVYTAGMALKQFPQDVAYDGDGYVLRRDGRRAALVHQFNRAGALIAFVDELVKRNMDSR